MKALLSLACVSFLVLLGCQTPLEAPARGSLTLVVQGQGGRTILPANNTIASYRATGSGPSGATVTQSSNTGSFTIPDLAYGAWTFTVEGLDGGEVVATGTSGTVTIAGGTEPTVPIALVLVTGTGTLDLAVSWPSARTITAVTGTLTPDDGSSAMTLNFTVSGYSATFSGTLATGSAVLVVRALNGTREVARSRAEAVLIAKNKASTWSASLADDEFVSSSKDITAFRFASPGATGTIADKQIVVAVPASTDRTNLAPYISLSPGAEVSPPSGEANDFTNPVPYTVTAADGTTKNYTITVTPLVGGTPQGRVLNLSNAAWVTTIRSDLTTPWGIAFDGTYLYVGDRATNEIRKLDREGSPVATLTHAQFTAPEGLVADGEWLYVANFDSGTVSRVNLASWTVDEPTFATGFNHPSGLTSDGTSLYVSDHGDSRVSRVNLSDGGIEWDFVTGLNAPNGLCTDGTSLYIANSGATNILRVDKSTGGAAAVFVASSVTGNQDIVGMTTDGTSLYLANFGANTIDRIALADPTQVSPVVGSGTKAEVDGQGASASFNRPAQVVSDGVNLYVTDQGGGTVRKVSP